MRLFPRAVLKKKPTSNLKSAEGEKKIAQSSKDSTINTNRNQPRTKSTEDEKKNIQSPKNTAVDAVKTRPRIKSTPDFLPSIGPAARSLEDINPQAEKEIEYARGFLKTGRFTGYKKGIDLCRDVLRDYPDTKYADQARDLLKTVPERYQKRYNVTDEEMGL